MVNPINPLAFSLGAVRVTWYGIILGMATMIGLFFAIREGRRHHIVPDFTMNLLLVVLPSALIGARAYYVIFNGFYYHPTFLYESLWNLIGLALVLILRRQNLHRTGELFLSYFIWYSLGRFLIEGLRTDSLAFSGPIWLEKTMKALWTPMELVFTPGYMAYGNIRISQLLSVGIIMMAMTFIYDRRKKTAPLNGNCD